MSQKSKYLVSVWLNNREMNMDYTEDWTGRDILDEFGMDWRKYELYSQDGTHNTRIHNDDYIELKNNDHFTASRKGVIFG